MATLDVLIYGDPVLKQVAEPIKKITSRHHRLAADMVETMYDAQGIGLAANQVGVLERIAVVDVEWAKAKEGEKPEKKPTVLINPEILEESVEDAPYEEGCLSIPNIKGEVWRPVSIKLRYQTLEGQTVVQDCDDLLARCVQHEVDHLNGVLFIDRMGKLKRALLRRSLNQLLKSRNQPAEPV